MNAEASSSHASAVGTIKAKHWIGSGIAAVLVLHMFGFLISRAIRLAEIASTDVGPHIHIAVIAVQLTSIVAWIFLPVALLIWRRAALKGSPGIASPAMIGFALPTVSWMVVAPVTQFLIPAMIAASILTGVLIGVIAWFILTSWVPDAFSTRTQT